MDSSRRRFVQGLTGGALLVAGARGMSWSLGVVPGSPPNNGPVLRGTQFDLEVAPRQVNFTGALRTATAVNGQIPGPLLYWRQGDSVTLRVTNRLAMSTSIHWHGIILPAGMDGVPALSFPGIRPGETFTYRFDLKQSGTYWYHSHSGFQEQVGLYGPLIVTPRDGERHPADREHVILLSDWTDLDPAHVYRILKVQSDYFNYGKRTAGDFLADARRQGLGRTVSDRWMWGQMRMNPTDLLDVSGHTYTYLMNGTTPTGNWTGKFERGERVRLRIINGSAMTLFDFRVPGLKLTVVAADGQDIEPVTVDEFRLAPAEIYDVIVEPQHDRAYTIFAQSIDRTGYARGTLAPADGMQAEIPPMDPRPLLSMADMGMSMAGMSMPGMDMSGSDHEGMDMSGMDTSGMDMSGSDHKGMDMGQAPATDHKGMDMSQAPVTDRPAHTVPDFGPNVDAVVQQPNVRLDDPGVGLRNNGRRVLTYADLRTLGGPLDSREPGREIKLHLTGHMERFVWSLDGRKFSESQPLRFNYGERLRVVLVNDSMMAHPMHLHGMWSEIETPEREFLVRKHTLIVQPGQQVGFAVSADALGRWAFHCHLLYHMEAGMFREVVVGPPGTTGEKS